MSKALIEKLGNPTPEGTWCGSIKTVSGIKTISTPFYQLCLMDVNNGVNFIRALEIDSIGQSSTLDYNEYMEICSTLRINPRLVQKPSGDFIHIFVGLDALSLLGHLTPVLPDNSTKEKSRRVHYPSPFFDNLRLFSTPLNDKLFFAGFFRKPIGVNSMKFSKAGFNGFVLPHNKVDT